MEQMSLKHEMGIKIMKKDGATVVSTKRLKERTLILHLTNTIINIS